MVKIPPLKTPTNVSKTSVSDLIDKALEKPPVTVVAESGAVTHIEAPIEPQAAAPAAQAAPVNDSDLVSGATGEGLPWEDANPRILSFFQLRLPEPTKLKLEWLLAKELAASKHLPKSDRPSQHSIALEALERELDRLVAKHLKKK